MKQFALVALVSASLFGALSIPALSQTGGGDSLEVRVSPDVILSASIEQDFVDYGTLKFSGGNADDQRTKLAFNIDFVAKNTGNVTADLIISGSNAVPADGSTHDPWILSCSPDTTGTVGENLYVLRFWPNPGGSLASAQPLCTTEKLLKADVIPWVEGNSAEVKFRLELNMPTGSDGYGPRKSSVTVTAIAPDSTP